MWRINAGGAGAAAEEVGAQVAGTRSGSMVSRSASMFSCTDLKGAELGLAGIFVAGYSWASPSERASSISASRLWGFEPEATE
jgi:hypothetical protein